MNKGLEVLANGKKRTKVVATLDNGNALLSKQEVEAIEKELKRLEEIDNVMFLNNKKLKALEIMKELFEFDFALRFPDNQPMMMITNKYGGSYFEIPISKEKYDLLREVML